MIILRHMICLKSSMNNGKGGEEVLILDKYKVPWMSTMESKMHAKYTV